jgi:class 3 adenylate cyclase
MDQPPIQFTSTDDRVNIAYWTLGSGFPVIFLNAATASHLGYEWRLPRFRGLYEELARHFQLVRYSTRNAGLSDRNVADLSRAAFASDLSAVVNAISADRVGLISSGYMGEVALHYAAAEPDRVAAIVLFGVGTTKSIIGAAQGVSRIGERVWAETAARWIDPEGVDPKADLVELIAESVDTADRSRILDALAGWTDGEGMPSASTPTLAFYWPNSATEREENVRAYAAAIPNMQLVTRTGNAPAWYDPHIDQVTDTIATFIGEAAGIARTDSAPIETQTTESAFRTILFTDVEASTALTDRFGDAKARDLLREHERLTRDALAAHGGTEIKTMGDGFMASFTSASSALDAAIAMQQAITAHFVESETAIRIRVGINAGEPIEEDDDLYGASVIRAARVMGQADGGEILVTDVVRQLVEGKEYGFSQRGEVDLKGFEEAVRLFEVRWG